MLSTPTIRQIPTDNPLVHAFHITGTVTGDDMQAMAGHMNAAFDALGKVDVAMLLIFDGFAGRETGAAMNVETMKAQFRSLAHVARYAVVGAPDAAETMIQAMDHVIPTKAHTFDAADIDAAWAWVGARPA